MRPDKEFDAAILGAGIAGISLARSLTGLGVRVLLLDKSKAGSGASGAPLALLNPATGRRAKKAWNAGQCMQKTVEVLRDLQEINTDPIFAENSVLRPSIFEGLSEHFRKSPQKYDWPDSWIQWLDEEEIKKTIPGVTCYEGGLRVNPASTVHLPNYIRASLSDLQESGVGYLNNTNPEIVKHNNAWSVRTDNYNYSVRYLFHTAGHGITNFSEWKFLNLHPVKGQILTVFFEKDIPFDCSISALGYIARLPAYPKMLVIGSTYEHNFKFLDPDPEGKEYLFKKLKLILPGMTQKISEYEQWSGIRISTPNYLPVIGEHPKIKNLFVYTGLGSKGLLYGQHCADLLAEQLVNNKPVPDEISINRFLNV